VLAAALRTVMTAPRQARPALEHAVRVCREAGDTDGEVAAIAQLAMVCWLRQDRKVRDGPAARIAALAAEGHRGARELVGLRSAFVADVFGEEDEVLHHLGRLDLRRLPPLSRALAAAVEVAIHYSKGDPGTAQATVTRVLPEVDPSLRWFVEGIGVMSRQGLGHLDEVVAQLPRLMDAARTTGSVPIAHPGMSIAAVTYASAGRTAAARATLDELRALVPPRVGSPLPVLTMLATISVQVAEGDEAQARSTLVHTLNARGGIDQGMQRRWWRHALALTYVLAPEARAHWDATRLDGQHAVARDLARLIVRQRSTASPAHLHEAELPDLPVVRSLLHHRHAAELAAGLAAVGRPEGNALLDLLGPPGRDALRSLAEAPTPSKPARALLVAAPAPPPSTTHVLVLGHLGLRRTDGADGPGDDVVAADLRRRRVRELLAFLVDERHTTRNRVMAALWPDRDERAAGNNLAVTLNWLLRLLEPWRGAGEPPYLVRLDGPTLRLATGEHLRIDVDEFEAHRSAAATAERERAAPRALAHHLAAVELYRGDLGADIDAEWMHLSREHYRTRYLDSAVRAAGLLLDRGDTDRAEAVAHKALATDAWLEEAYAVLVRVALVRHDRSGARRLLHLCLDALAELGVGPSDGTVQLQRRLAMAGPEPGPGSGAGLRPPSRAGAPMPPGRPG
jgi:DNA-binding SARP family transcriptional activator